jgi:hypothetical protein
VAATTHFKSSRFLCRPVQIKLDYSYTLCSVTVVCFGVVKFTIKNYYNLISIAHIDSKPNAQTIGFVGIVGSSLVSGSYYKGEGASDIDAFKTS